MRYGSTIQFSYFTSMKLFPYTIFVLVLILLSCVPDSRTERVYQNDSTSNELEIDTTLVFTSELPIHFMHTDYLLFPIGPLQSYGRDSKLYLGSGSSGGKGSFVIGYLSGFTYSGQLHNIKIQHKDSTQFRSITTQAIRFNNFHFLESIREKSGLQLLVLEATDTDSNHDGKLDTEDIQSLYISNLSGSNFTKLSPDNHELLDWRVVPVNSRLYFRTIEDVNKNGEFDNNDVIHYHYTNLEINFETIDYDPLR